MARGMLADDNEWHLCMTEAASFQTGSQYRQLFCAIICNHDEANARDLFDTHFVPLSDDMRRTLERLRLGLEPSEQDINYNRLLPFGIGERNPSNGRQSRFGRFRFTSAVSRSPRTTSARKRLVNEERDYDRPRMQDIVGCELNADQSLATERILDSVSGEPKVFFLQGPGGTGKTFVENYLLAKVRLEAK